MFFRVQPILCKDSAFYIILQYLRKVKWVGQKNALPIYYITYLLSYLAFTDIFIFFPSTDTMYMPLAGATTLPLEPCATTLPDMS